MSWNESWRRRRHHPAVRLCAHSHEWIVRWLEWAGWKKDTLHLPSRRDVLNGAPDPGWQQMILLGPDKTHSIRVPGARTPKARLSIHEWSEFTDNLEGEYNQLGQSVPPARNRLRRT